MAQTPGKILQLTGAMDCGGSETLLMNLLRNSDREKIIFDFAVIPNREFFYSEEIKKLGGAIYPYPFKTKRTLLLPFYAFSVAKVLLTKGPYAAVHTHFRFMNGVALAIAWACGVKKRFSHSHGEDRPSNNLFVIAVRRFMRAVNRIFATRQFACSEAAGISLYGGGFEVINNGISTRDYAFNAAARAAKRAELGLSDKFIVAHTGRFFREKNHKFLLEIFAEILRIQPNAVLLLMGGGFLEEEIKLQAKSLNIADYVKLLGVRRDVPDILKAADAFVFPSVREGLPLSGVEAQAAGLPCFFSDIITRDIEICNAFFWPLSDTAQDWARKIIEHCKNFERKDTSALVKQAGFDIKNTAEKMQQIYLG